MKRRLLLGAFLIISHVQALEPVVISIGVINDIGNSLTDIQQHEFQTNLEKSLQSHPTYIRTINPQYDQEIISALKRILAGPTKKDIDALGQLQNIDKIVIVNIYKVKESVFSFNKKYKCDARLIDVRTGFIQTFNYSNVNQNAMAKDLANGIYESLWLGLLVINTNMTGYSLYIDNNIDQVHKKRIEKKLLIGAYNIKLNKSGYRQILDKINIKNGSIINRQYNFIKEGSKLEIDGSPSGAKIILTLTNDNTEISGKIPFNQLINKGEYNLKVKAPGFQDEMEHVIIKDKKDQRLTIDLQQISLNSQLKKSLIIPGWGQMFSGYRWKGVAFSVAEAASVVVSAGFIYLYTQKKAARKDTYSKYLASGNPSLRSVIHNQENRMRVYQGFYIGSITLGTGVYFYNLYDIYKTHNQLLNSLNDQSNKKNIENSRKNSEKAFKELDSDE